MGGLLHLVHRGGAWAGFGPAHPFIANFILFAVAIACARSRVDALSLASYNESTLLLSASLYFSKRGESLLLAKSNKDLCVTGSTSCGFGRFYLQTLHENGVLW